ncbi:hypothetical protein [Thiobacillus sp. 65-1402]|uniref:hypothetical protein n=1 Tax=Thiobacillus sp. 65-1402 TaxID=1895861 RepID=UPI0009655C41|nr:hypothetical protein [Thiobacillus sp. 65-1402]OJW96538.1 MAG: hypothetical protein BGO62_04645 [Thiobacillus sp. 65-1402]
MPDAKRCDNDFARFRQRLFFPRRGCQHPGEGAGRGLGETAWEIRGSDIGTRVPEQARAA